MQSPSHIKVATKLLANVCDGRCRALMKFIQSIFDSKFRVFLICSPDIHATVVLVFGLFFPLRTHVIKMTKSESCILPAN